MYVIKIGDLYLTDQGTVSPFQRNAMRVSDDVTIGQPTINGQTGPRMVRLRPPIGTRRISPKRVRRI